VLDRLTRPDLICVVAPVTPIAQAQADIEAGRVLRGVITF
jgi:hypothetical protein